MLDLIRVISVSVDSGCVAYAASQCAGHRFYRATLCVSAVFAIAGCPSVTLVDCIQTAEDIVKLLYRPGSAIIRVFLPQMLVSNSKGNPFSGVQNTRGWKDFAIFDWSCCLSRKWYEIGPWLLWNVNRKSYALCQMVTLSMTLMETGFQGHSIFEVKYISKKRVLGTSYYRTLIRNHTQSIEWYHFQWHRLALD